MQCHAFVTPPPHIKHTHERWYQLHKLNCQSICRNGMEWKAKFDWFHFTQCSGKKMGFWYLKLYCFCLWAESIHHTRVCIGAQHTYTACTAIHYPFSIWILNAMLFIMSFLQQHSRGWNETSISTITRDGCDQNIHMIAAVWIRGRGVANTGQETKLSM